MINLDRAHRIVRDTVDLLEKIARESGTHSNEARNAAYDLDRVRRFLKDMRQQR